MVCVGHPSLRTLVRRRIVPAQAKTNWTHPCQCTLIAHGTLPRSYSPPAMNLKYIPRAARILFASLDTKFSGEPNAG